MNRLRLGAVLLGLTALLSVNLCRAAPVTFRAAAQASVTSGTGAATSSITFVAAGTVGQSSSTTMTMSAALPPHNAGDFLVCTFEARNNGAINTPAGWTELYTYSGDSGYRSKGIYKFATVTTATNTSLTVTKSLTTDWIGRCAVYRGVNPTTPLDVSPPTNSYTSGNTISSGSGLTPVTNGVMLLFAAHADQGTSITGPTGGWTTGFVTNNLLNNAIGLYHKPWNTTATGTVTASTSNSGRNHGVLMALRPSTGPPPPPGGSLTINKPAGTIADDVMIASVAVTADTATVANVIPPAGWILIREVFQNAGTGTADGARRSKLITYRLTAGASEPASYTWTISGVHTGAVGGIASFSNVDLATPVDFESGVLTAAAQTHAAPSINTSADGMLVTAHEFASSRTWTGNAGMTEAVDIFSAAANGATGISMGMYHEPRPSGGLTGIRTASTSPATTPYERGATQSVSLKPRPVIISTVNHYHIAHSGSGLSCEREAVTIYARDAAKNTISAEGATINLSTVRVAGDAGNHGDWTILAGLGSINNGAADDGMATFTFAAGQTTAQLALKNTHAQTVNINVSDGASVTEASGTGNTELPYDANLQFVSSVFRISNGANALTTIDNQIAGVTSTTYYLQAIGSDAGGTCTAFFVDNADVAIELGFECINPIACQPGKLVTITNNGNASAIAANPIGNVTAFTAKALRFGTGEAEAPFTLTYPDVGQIRLHVRYNIPLEGGAPSGIYMIGASNAFVVKPYDFIFSNIERTSDGQDNPAAVDANGSVFVRAGEAFSATVTSVNAQGIATPNFGKETPPEGLRLTSQLATGLNLDNNPALTNGVLTGFNGGAATGTTFSWGEVGIIQLQAVINDTDYLGAGDVEGSLTGNVGRFQPYDFEVSVNIPEFESFCGSDPDAFTYVGQNFHYTAVPIMTVTARNIAGDTTVNYGKAGGWFKLTNASLSGKSYTAAVGTLDIGLLPPVDPEITNNADGTAILTFSSGGGLRFARSMPAAPFEADIRLEINVRDGDNPAVLYASNPAHFGQAIAGNGIDFDDGKQMRFGRLRIQNALGSEQLQLPIPMRLEYWDGSHFVLNTQDDCTTVPQTTLAMDNYLAGLGICATRFSGDITFSGGRANPLLSAPGQSGSVDIRILTGAVPGGPFEDYCAGPAETDATAGALSHLRGRWNDGVNGAGYDDDPVARAAFGLYGVGRASQRFIYSRENY